MLHQRFEFKYLIGEPQAEGIAEYIQPYVVPDPHLPEGERAYAINSLYLDNDRLALFWSSRMGEMNRIKLRIRAYSDRPDDPVFLEIKRRQNLIIQKQRVTLRRPALARVLSGGALGSDDFVHPTEKEHSDFRVFRDLMERLSATPRTAVGYVRETYVGQLDDRVRVTIDRRLSYALCRRYTPDVWSLDAYLARAPTDRLSHWHEVPQAPVVLEIKFTDAYPEWVRRTILQFNLSRDSFAKYVTCVEMLDRGGAPVGGPEQSVREGAAR